MQVTVRRPKANKNVAVRTLADVQGLISTKMLAGIDPNKLRRAAAGFANDQASWHEGYYAGMYDAVMGVE